MSIICADNNFPAVVYLLSERHLLLCEWGEGDKAVGAKLLCGLYRGGAN